MKPAADVDRPVAFSQPDELPFKFEEPNTYTLEMAVTADGIERVTRISRDGARWRYDHGFGSGHQFGSIRGERNFLIDDRRKLYAEIAPRPDAAAEPLGTWYLSRPDVVFENLGSENGRMRYRVKIDGETTSEIIVYVDDTLKIPVRQEFFSLAGGRRELQYSVEVRKFSPEPDRTLFDIPAGYKKVRPEEIETEQ